MNSTCSYESPITGNPKDSCMNEGELLRTLVHFTGKQILELGGGDGRMTRHFAADSAYTILSDSDISELTTARQELSDTMSTKVALHNATAQHLPYPSNSFDIVVFSWSL